jgi:flagellar basal-body rod modification protein FlgD
MAIDPTSSIASNVRSSLDLQGLLNVLLAEMTNQNPLDPVKNQDFMAQVAQFASLDVTQQLNQNILQLLSLQALSQSVGLVNRNVSAVLADGATISGKVTAVTVNPQGAVSDVHRHLHQPDPHRFTLMLSARGLQ